MSVDIDSVYKRARAVLWVEDTETRAWLDSVWKGLSPNILVLAAGGHPHVAAVCAQAVDEGIGHIFGLVDQDFATSNRHRWASLNPTERVYRIDVHEVENLLIDADAMAGCKLNTKKRSSAEIETRLQAAAHQRAWWVACAAFLGATSEAATSGFPSIPGSVASLDDALAYVSASEWFATTAATCPALAHATQISTALAEAHQKATTALSDGSWRKKFPGKEIFRDVSGFVQPNVPGARARLDLAKAVGEWQILNNQVPEQIVELRRLILARVTP